MRSILVRSRVSESLRSAIEGEKERGFRVFQGLGLSSVFFYYNERVVGALVVTV